jgi:hypothetical protein
MKKTIRGYKLLKEFQRTNASVYLFKVNGTRFMISIQYHLFWITVKRRNFEFTDEHTAMRFYEKAATKLM